MAINAYKMESIKGTAYSVCAVYTETKDRPVADGWAGSEMRVLTLKLPTDGRTDKSFNKVLSPRLKR